MIWGLGKQLKDKRNLTPDMWYMQSPYNPKMSVSKELHYDIDNQHVRSTINSRENLSLAHLFDISKGEQTHFQHALDFFLAMMRKHSHYNLFSLLLKLKPS